MLEVPSRHVQEHGRGRPPAMDTSNAVGMFLTTFTPGCPVNEIETVSPLAGGDLISFALDHAGASQEPG